MSDAIAAVAADTTDVSAAATDPGAAATASGAADVTTPAADVTTQAAADWRAGLEGDYAEFAKRLGSPIDAVKVAFDLRKANSSMIRVPGADAKPEQIAAYRKALGAGETVEAYAEQFKAPEGAELSETDKLVTSKVAEVLHKHNVPLAAAPELQGAITEIAANIEAEQDRVAVAAREQSLATLRKEWGAEFEANTELAKRALTQFASDGLKDFLNNTTVNGAKLGDHPELIRLLGTIGRRTGEGEFIGADGTDQKTSLNAELDRIYAENPVGTERFRSKAVQDRIRAINESLYGTTSIVGAGRSV